MAKGLTGNATNSLPCLRTIVRYRTDRVHTRVGSGLDFPYGITAVDGSSAALWLPNRPGEVRNDVSHSDEASLLLAAATPHRQLVTAGLVWKLKLKVRDTREATSADTVSAGASDGRVYQPLFIPNSRYKATKLLVRP